MVQLPLRHEPCAQPELHERRRGRRVCCWLSGARAVATAATAAHLAVGLGLRPSALGDDRHRDQRTRDLGTDRARSRNAHRLTRRDGPRRSAHPLRGDGRDASVISSDIGKESDVTDILIRDVPDEVLAAIDVKAKRLGLSRTAYLRRALERERIESPGPVTVDALERLASLTADLDDAGVMSDAWS